MSCDAMNNSEDGYCSRPRSSGDPNIDKCCNLNDTDSTTRDQAACVEKCCNEPHSALSGAQDCVPKKQSNCVTNCCDSSSSTCENAPPAVLQSNSDLEQGPPEYHKVILQVEGMDCTSCEKNLIAAIQQLSAAVDVKTSFTIARAEFLLNTNRMSVEEAVINLQRTTKYAFKVVLEENAHSLTVIVDNASSFCQQDRPAGVLDMVQVDSRSVEIKYDAFLLGARKLLEHGFGEPLSLAPDRIDRSLASRRRKLRRDWTLFLTVTALTIPVLVFAWSPASDDPDKDLWFDGVSMILATFVQLTAIWKFYRPAFQDLIFRRAAEVDMLISLSTTAAYVFSAVSFGMRVKGRPLESGQFFETSTLLVTIVLFSSLISEMARHKALKSVSIR
jgi:cation transport ATPase